MGIAGRESLVRLEILYKLPHGLEMSNDISGGDVLAIIAGRVVEI